MSKYKVNLYKSENRRLAALICRSALLDDDQQILRDPLEWVYEKLPKPQLTPATNI